MSSELLSTTPQVKQPGLSERMRASVESLWRRQFHHPFVVALGDGTLPQSNFQFYICQDALFLDVLSKTFAYAATRASDQHEMEQFNRYALDTLLVEAELHRNYGARFGLTPAQMATIPMAPSAYAYTRHLLAIATTGSLPEILTAVLPCAWIYAEIGRHLIAAGPPSADHPYADWLATYASPDFDAVGAWLRERLDRHCATITPQEEARLHNIFLISTRYEWLFWEMAWHLEEWPS
ncbi:MAG TPA: thiaminase II [Ktedonosporobacter sp.]|jgi:thiaminase/transcriptional activator TenA|nr:thiaminase II [Ktedonosporobacter sp.]